MSGGDITRIARETAQQCAMQPGLEYDAVLAALRQVTNDLRASLAAQDALLRQAEEALAGSVSQTHCSDVLHDCYQCAQSIVTLAAIRAAREGGDGEA